MRHLVRTLGLTVASILLLAPPAGAATASFDATTAQVSYTAAPGERNGLDVAYGEPAGCYCEIVVYDTGAVVTAGPGCVSIDAHSARCTYVQYVVPGSAFRRTVSTSVDVGDGDDTVTAPSHLGAQMSVGGGTGNDTLRGAGNLVGGPGNDVLTGGDDPLGYKGSGPPPDYLSGGPGDDVLRGGLGNDELYGGAGADIIDGGPEADSVSYEDRTAGVRVDLADPEAAQGEPGENDRLIDIERVTGGSGDDVLLGSAQRDRLRGVAGDDRLVGRGGRDWLDGGAGVDVLDGGADNDDLDGGAGRDTLRGGAGNDRILARGDGDSRPLGGSGDVLDGGAGNDLIYPGRARSLRCGSGRDVVSRPGAGLLTGCESVVVGGVYTDSVTVSADPRRRPRGGLRFGWVCTATSGRCEIRLTLRLANGAMLGRRSAVLVMRDAEGTLDLRPRRSLRRGRVLQVSVSLAVSATRTHPFTARWSIRL